MYIFFTCTFFCVLVIHEFDVSPINVTVSSEASRSVIRLTCHINSVPEAIITWEKDGVSITSDNKR